MKPPAAAPNDRCSSLRWSAFLALPLVLLTGCLFTTRKLPTPRSPQVVQTATGEELVEQINKRCDALHTLVATVEIQTSVTRQNEGIARDYTTIRGHILMRTPEKVRVLGQVPVLGTQMFDMASDGKTFTLFIPPRSIAYTGSNAQPPKPSAGLQNLRPGLFFDAMFVRCIGPDEEYTKTADTDTQEDPAKKHLLMIPEYILSVMRPQPNSRELQPLRVIHIHREDLLPYQQDLYDEHNNLETQIVYGRYADFGDNKFPSTITIKRPQENTQVVLTVEKVTENMPLTDDQFQIKIPEGTKIQNVQ